MSKQPVKVVKPVEKRIRDKIAAGKVLTPRQKLKMLRRTRDLLDTNYTDANWSQFIDGVERFCVYGAIEKLSGLTPCTRNDKLVNSCSLTSTLFDAAPNKSSKRSTYTSIDMWEAQGLRDYVMREKASYLQSVNDDDKDEILKIVDLAIKNLEKEITNL